MTTARRRLAGQIGAHQSWANTIDRAARTAPARAAMDQRFLDAAGGDPVRAEHLRKAHYKRMTAKSVESRRRAREARAAGQSAVTAIRQTIDDAAAQLVHVGDDVDVDQDTAA